MITAITGPLVSKPSAWVVVFDRTAANRWIGALTPGRFKHVRAYGYVPFLHVWLFVDANLKGIEVVIAATGAPADALSQSWAAGCDLVVMPRREHINRGLPLAMSGWCVPVVRRLIGLPGGALRPDAFFAECLRNGGKHYERGRSSPAGTDDRGGNGTPAGLRAPAG